MAFDFDEKAFQQGQESGLQGYLQSQKPPPSGGEDALMRMLLMQKFIDARQDKSLAHQTEKEERSEIRQLGKDLGVLAPAAEGVSVAKEALTGASPEVKKDLGKMTWLPNWIKPYAMGAGESMGFIAPGTQETAQKVQGAINELMKLRSGGSVVGTEEARLDLETGIKAGNAELIQQGLDKTERILRAHGRSLAAGYEPERLQTYLNQGPSQAIKGIFQQQPHSAPVPQAPTQNQPMSFEEFKAARKAGKI